MANHEAAVSHPADTIAVGLPGPRPVRLTVSPRRVIRQRHSAPQERRRCGEPAPRLRPASRALELQGDLLVGPCGGRSQMPRTTVWVGLSVGRLLAAADAARPGLGYLTPGFTADRRAAARAARQVRHFLGNGSFSQAWQQGQALTLDDAIAYTARRGGGRKRPATGWASLTPAELEVIRLAAAGLRNQAIAQRLFVAPGTVKTHLTHIFTKLGITTRTELAAQAATHELRTHQTTPLPCDDLRLGAGRHRAG